MVTFSTEDKGEAIYITGGKYVGLNGWRWLGKGNPIKQTYVIVALENDEEKGVRINKGNVGPPRGPPTDYIDAVLQQYTDIDQALNKVCKLLAKCHLNGAEKALQQKFLDRMRAAAQQQLAEGTKATWYVVDYEEARIGLPCVDLSTSPTMT
jgi:hypothetical protein